MISSQVGLAVGDTETMKKFTTIKRLAMQIEYQIEIEEALPSFLTRTVYETLYVERPNKLTKYYRYGVSSIQISAVINLLNKYCRGSLNSKFCPKFLKLPTPPCFSFKIVHFSALLFWEFVEDQFYNIHFQC